MPDDKCKRCNDKGYLHADSAYCPDCNGQGIGPYYPTDTVKCKTCLGSGRVGRSLCDGEPNPLSGECDRDQVDIIQDCPDCNPSKSPIKIDTSDQHGDATDMIDHIPDAGQKVQPPAGYKTWLDYATETAQSAYSLDVVFQDRKVCRALARAELAELRACKKKFIDLQNAYLQEANMQKGADDA